MTAIERPHHAARHRAIFLSDIHLGTRGCQAEMLLDFLKKNESEYLYLVGDIVDGWRLKRWWYWPRAHNDVVQKIMRKARKGTNVIYIPGNHDEAARQYCQLTFGDVRVEEEWIHETPDGKKLLVIHGDQFDGIVRYAKWLAILGDWAYTVALRINTTFNWARRKLGLNYWSLSAYLKHKVKNAVQFIADFEDAVADEARRRGVDGVVCGHIHHPEIRDDRRHPVLQRRRLGGELHRAGRGFRRPPAHRALGRGGCARALDAAVPRAGAAGGGVAGLRIAIVSDAWRPQINGVVRTIETIARLLQAEGHEVEVFGPDRFRTLPCPTYPEIRLSLFPASRLHHMLKLFAPDAIHLVTEGPLGWAARAFCLKRDIPFTTAYHTRFPEYVHARIRMPLAWSYAFVRRFHAPSAAVLVVAQSIRDELTARGFRNLVPWSRGVDITAFKPRERDKRS